MNHVPRTIQGQLRQALVTARIDPSGALLPQRMQFASQHESGWPDGCTETPRVARGKVALVLHLLSPAHRPVQVTRDLAGSGGTSYFDVRKDLRALSEAPLA